VSLKSVIDDACIELSLPPLISVVENKADPQAQLLRRLVTAEGRALLKRHAWQRCVREWQFATTATPQQPHSIPVVNINDWPDFDRYIPETMWDRTRKRPVYGPIDSAEWASIQSSFVTSINPGFRFMADMVYLTPTPPHGDVYSFEYVSRNWAYTGGSVWRDHMSSDDDRTLLDEEALTLGVIYRFRADKGFEFGDDLKEYERRVADLIMTDGSRPRLQRANISSERVPRAPQAPQTIVWP